MQRNGEEVWAISNPDLDSVYTERNMCVALLLRMALRLGLPAGLGQHKDVPGEEWDEEWRNVAFLDLPSGQVSWHIKVDEMKFFSGLPCYTGAWDGHSTAEKYRRVLDPQLPEGAPSSDFFINPKG